MSTQASVIENYCPSVLSSVSSCPFLGGCRADDKVCHVYDIKFLHDSWACCHVYLLGELVAAALQLLDLRRRIA